MNMDTDGPPDGYATVVDGRNKGWGKQLPFDKLRTNEEIDKKQHSGHDFIVPYEMESGTTYDVICSKGANTMHTPFVFMIDGKKYTCVFLMWFMTNTPQVGVSKTRLFKSIIERIQSVPKYYEKDVLTGDPVKEIVRELLLVLKKQTGMDYKAMTATEYTNIDFEKTIATKNDTYTYMYTSSRKRFLDVMVNIMVLTPDEEYSLNIRLSGHE